MVWHQLPKLRVAGSSPVSRSTWKFLRLGQPADFVLGKTVALEIFIVHKNAIAFIVSLRWSHHKEVFLWLRFCLGSVRAVTAVALVFSLSRPSATLVSLRVGRDLLQWRKCKEDYFETALRSACGLCPRQDSGAWNFHSSQKCYRIYCEFAMKPSQRSFFYDCASA